MDMTIELITAPIADFCRISGLGRTKVYELLRDGTLASITVGKRRLVVLDSYRQLIERQQSLANQQAAAATRRRDAARVPAS